MFNTLPAAPEDAVSGGFALAGVPLWPPVVAFDAP